jgi:hypothetical protein
LFLANNYGINTGRLKQAAVMPSKRSPGADVLRTQAQRFSQARRELLELEYFVKGTVLKRMMKCGRTQCACHHDPSKRHGPYFEWTYKANGKTVNVKLTAESAPLYKAATKQQRKLKAILARLERLSRTALASLAKQAESGD